VRELVPGTAAQTAAEGGRVAVGDDGTESETSSNDDFTFC